MGLLWREIALFAAITGMVAPLVWLVIAWRRSRVRARQELDLERLAALKAAIERGVLRESDRDRVLEALAGRLPGAPPAVRLQPWQWCAGLGWVLGFVGIGLWAIADRDARSVGTVMALGGLGLLTLPLALRELARGRAA